jgi:hypothetical protein
VEEGAHVLVGVTAVIPNCKQGLPSKGNVTLQRVLKSSLGLAMSKLVHHAD